MVSVHYKQRKSNASGVNQVVELDWLSQTLG